MLITDHGNQFRKQFKQAIEVMGITQIKGRVRQPIINVKRSHFCDDHRLPIIKIDGNLAA